MRGEGKTLAAANLALSYSEGGAHSVALIDACLGTPRLTELLGAAPRQEPLSEGDLNGAGIELWQFRPNLFLVPALGPRNKRSVVLSSPAFAMLLLDLRQVLDYIIIDAPAVVSGADAKIVMRSADAGLLMTKARSTQGQMVQVALDRLGRNVMAGVVLNEFGR
jgi:Mrp family chromosome partitioning ATPase